MNWKEGGSLKTVNLDDVIDVDEIPVCPICGSVIDQYHGAWVGICADSIFLVHRFCAKESMPLKEPNELV